MQAYSSSQEEEHGEAVESVEAEANVSAKESTDSKSSSSSAANNGGSQQPKKKQVTGVARILPPPVLST